MANTPGALIPVFWAGTDWNAGDNPADGTTRIITSVDGWYGSAPLVGNDVDLALSDGALLGLKTIDARQITLNGYLAGPRAPLLALVREVSELAAARGPVALTCGELDETGGSVPMLTAQVRADSGNCQVTWVGRYLAQWQVALVAPDPLLYEAGPRTATLTVPGGTTGRTFTKHYMWGYAALATNATTLLNPGTAPTRVQLVFTGPLTTPRVSDGVNTIALKTIGNGEVVTVISDTLLAYAPGGATRASYVQAGSVPMLLGTGSTTWSLYSSGTGSVALTWSGAWS